jgi:uncharacterized delta-60 repeat protein
MSAVHRIGRDRRAAGALTLALLVGALAALVGTAGALPFRAPPLQRELLFGGGESGFASVGESVPGYHEAAAVAVAPDGGILVAGDGGEGGGAIVRFKAGGRLDRPYGGGAGYVALPGVSGINAMAVASDGGAAVLSQRQTLTRVTAAGVLDTSFGAGGTVSLPALGPAFEPLHLWSVAFLPNGDLLAAGIRFGSPRMVVVRLLPDGAVDPSFGEGGLTTLGFGSNPNAGATAMAVEPDGDIVLAGYAHRDLALARLLPDGAPDPSFGTHGISALPTFVGQATALAPRTDGSLLVVGYGARRDAPDQRENFLLRFGSDGTLDRSFGSAARRMPEGRAYATPIAVLPTHGHVFVATVGHGPSLRAYRADGLEGGRLGDVKGVPRERFFGTAVTLDRGKLLLAWTPAHQPTRGAPRLERFRVRP